MAAREQMNNAPDSWTLVAWRPPRPSWPCAACLVDAVIPHPSNLLNRNKANGRPQAWPAEEGEEEDAGEGIHHRHTTNG